ncbi:MAG TPA: ABC transporter substrate-binding protein [Dehalococcoidia bacterium]|jgi:peptide/nickel transport system substrate-binding protein|nr:ABC transporter substrate-binding protein [Dehalococcoidia bacterium]
MAYSQKGVIVMSGSYWNRVLDSRISRRRALATTGAGAAAAAFLAACGSDDDGGDGGGGSSSNDLVASYQDTLKQAKTGGILKEVTNSEPANLDAMQPLASLNFQARNVYGTLLKEEAGYKGPSQSKIIGDLAQSWEFSPDKLTLTMKLRQGVKFHNKPPVNGRVADVNDILFSWKRYKELGALRANISNEVNKDAPILSMEAPDNSTIVVKLKEPLVFIHKYLASYGSFTGNLMMYPKEAESGFDIKQDMIGHGPWYLSEKRVSVGYTFKRNPDYYEKDHVFADEMQMPIIPEYASRLAQLKAGNIHFLDMRQNAEDVVATRNEQPKLLIYAQDFTPRTEVVTFGMAGDSPFKDERVRQAVSMAMDRETMIDAFFNVSRFESDGLSMESRWNTAIQAEWKPGNYWLDPKGKDFGPNAKYFEYNIEEAKKLLSAAGFPSGFTTTMRYPQSPQYSLQRYGEPWAGQLQSILKVNLDAKTDYTKDYIPNLRDAKGAYEGLGMHSVTGTTPQRISPESDLAAQFWPKGGVTFHGFGDNQGGDPQLTAIIEKARLEFDENARKKLIQDAQRYLGKAQWALSQPGGANTFNLAWPAVGNYFAWSNHTWGPAHLWTYRLWLDQTKAPFV